MATTKPRGKVPARAAKRVPSKQPGSSTAERSPDKRKVAGSTPAPATKALTPWEQFKASAGSMDALCAYILDGNSLNQFCLPREFPYSSMCVWINAEPGRAAMYARAREDRSDRLADEIVAISDEIDVRTTTDSDGAVKLSLDAAAVARNRLRVDSRKWVASKLKPRVYGEKLELGGALKISSVSDEALVTELAKFGIAAKIGPQPEPEATGA